MGSSVGMDEGNDVVILRRRCVRQKSDKWNQFKKSCSREKVTKNGFLSVCCALWARSSGFMLALNACNPGKTPECVGCMAFLE
jgi:hypothetical protein